MKAVVLFSFAFPQCLWYTRARRHESGIFFSARAGGGRLGLAGMILLLSILMGKRSSVRKPADIPYECGMIPMGEGAPMFSVKFYMVAMLFVIFDLEVVFLYPWAVNFRDYIMMNPESFTAMCIFIGILLVAYLYALGKGALNWHHDPR